MDPDTVIQKMVGEVLAEMGGRFETRSTKEQHGDGEAEGGDSRAEGEVEEGWAVKNRCTPHSWKLPVPGDHRASVCQMWAASSPTP